ncbi:MAG: hypothetical protein AB4290_11535 [Spirulina sp.]
MTQTNSKQKPRYGRVFPEKRLSPEELERRKAESDLFLKRCHIIFDRVQPELLEEHYDWFIIIEPDSGDYFIDPDEQIARAKAQEKHPERKRLIMRINETGACGRI